MQSHIISLSAVVPGNEPPDRLDRVLARLFTEYSRTELQSWIKQGEVRVEGETVLKPTHRVRSGERIDVLTKPRVREIWEAQPLTLSLLYEDDAVLVVNKPAGLVVHPGAGQPDGTLVNALLNYAPELSLVPRAGIVHRLDKDTSGLLVVARTLAAHTHLVKQLSDRTVNRNYCGIVQGVLLSGGTVANNMGRSPYHRLKMAVVESGKEAITHYKILEKFRAHTLLSLNLETGRTHQIRVHMSSIHYPIAGDLVYGKRPKLPKDCPNYLVSALLDLKRQMLHAAGLSLIHPISGERVHWECPLPEDMQALLEVLREDRDRVDQS